MQVHLLLLYVHLELKLPLLEIGCASRQFHGRLILACRPGDVVRQAEDGRDAEIAALTWLYISSTACVAAGGLPALSD